MTRDFHAELTEAFQNSLGKKGEEGAVAARAILAILKDVLAANCPWMDFELMSFGMYSDEGRPAWHDEASELMEAWHSMGAKALMPAAPFVEEDFS